MRAAFLSLLLLLASFAGAQNYDLGQAHNAVIQLDGKVRFHLGGEQATPAGPREDFAAPAYDDSAWQLVSATARGAANSGAESWYRFSITVPTTVSRPLAMRIGILHNYAVYVDGRLLGGCGAVPPASPITLRLCPPRVIALPAAVPGHSLLIAIHGWNNLYGSRTGPYQPLEIGDSATVAGLQQAQDDDIQAYEIQQYVMVVLELLAIVFAVGLFLFRRSNSEYLWFAAIMMSNVVSIISDTHPLFHDDSVRLVLAVRDVIALTYTIPELLLYRSLFKARRTPFFYLAIASFVAQTVMNDNLWVYFHLQPLAPTLFDSVYFLLTLIPSAWVMILMVRHLRAGDINARILIVPAFIRALQEPYRLLSAVFDHVTHHSWKYQYFKPFTEHPFPISLGYLEDLLLIAALMVVLGLRFTRSHAAEERLQGDLEAARQVQQLLLPAAPASVPGFHLESAYLPAQQIGGDFFYVAPAEDGSLLLVVGDVSGKGLSAALTVSVIIGALRAAPEESPAATLRRLNRALFGHTAGFATCCAARIGINGRATLSNAGHLSPYLAGQEVPLEGGLPLGLLEDPAYDEQPLALAPGQTLTFVSDGVVEAAGRDGKLFGFARTEAISGQPAETIAQAARGFGQTDDITIVTVTLLGVAASHGPALPA